MVEHEQEHTDLDDALDTAAADTLKTPDLEEPAEATGRPSGDPQQGDVADDTTEDAAADTLKAPGDDG